MKYCPKCKLRMPVEATACRQCGAPLRTVGGAPADEAGSSSAAAGSDLTMQLQGLQHEVSRSRKSLYLAGGIACALSVLLVLLLVGLHFYHVMQYAEIAEVDVHLAERASGEAGIRFVRRNAGKVEFVREAAGRSETLIDHGRNGSTASGDEKSFVWSGSDSGNFTIRVRARSGWGTDEKTWVARDGKIQRAD
jgi:hypothetical protein